MKARVVSRVTISADLAAVFKYLTNLRLHKLWNPHLQRIVPLKIMQPGMHYETASLMLGIKVQGVNTVTKLLPNRELEIYNSTGALHYRVNYLLTAKNQKTLLTCNTEVSSEAKAFAFARPVLEALARRELQADLQLLKLVVEQGLS